MAQPMASGTLAIVTIVFRPKNEATDILRRAGSDNPGSGAAKGSPIVLVSLRSI